MNKKAIVFMTQWAEIFTVILLIIGFLLAVLIRNPSSNYLIITMCGLAIGRTLFKHRRAGVFPFYLISLGFIVGYVIGSFFSEAKTLVIIVLFLFSAVLSYYIHRNGYIK